jgi:hypothetical protein
MLTVMEGDGGGDGERFFDVVFDDYRDLLGMFLL